MESRKITAEEAQQLMPVQFGRKHPVRALLETLQPGEWARISAKDFTWKGGYTPNHFLKQISKSKKRKFNILKQMDGEGWVVERVK